MHPFLVHNEHPKVQPDQHAQQDEARCCLHKRHSKHNWRGEQHRYGSAVAGTNCVDHGAHSNAREDGTAHGGDTGVADVLSAEVEGVLRRRQRMTGAGPAQTACASGFEPLEEEAAIAADINAPATCKQDCMRDHAAAAWLLAASWGVWSCAGCRCLCRLWQNHAMHRLLAACWNQRIVTAGLAHIDCGERSVTSGDISNRRYFLTG